MYEKSNYVVVEFCAQKSRYADSQKVFFNLAKSLFKWNEGKSGSVCNLVALKEKKFLIWFFYEKKYSFRSQILRPYKSRYARFTKSDFQSSQDIVQMKWGQE